MTTTCLHLSEIARLQHPKILQSVHQEECTQCFDSQDQPLGIDVCLSCFNGGCLDSTRRHAFTHGNRSGHPFTLNVKRKPKQSPHRVEDGEPPTKITKLAIQEQNEEEKYEFSTVVKCWNCDPACGLEIPDAVVDPKIRELVNEVMHSMSSARRSEVKAWEEEIIACEHTLTLQQTASAPILPTGLACCHKCDLKENLWLCMTCGSLGCGRQQSGGLDGNGHALEHFSDSKHPFCVKLGTISPEGTADIYCYACDDPKVDPDIVTHLSTFGIVVQEQSKTEKSTTELQIDQNMKFDFSLTGDDGKALIPVYGPGLTGLKNLGNSCYMASVMQTLFALPAFQQRYQPLHAQREHWLTCTEMPDSCLDCQMYKMADGLLSGRYSLAAAPDIPPQSTSTPQYQKGIEPSNFKSLIGKGHTEFCTMRQQDAEEFFSYLITTIRRHAQVSKPDAQATNAFAFAMEQRLQCAECRRVKYRTDSMDVVSVNVPEKVLEKREDGQVEWEEVTLEECFDGLTRTEALEYRCPACEKDVIATKQMKFATFPDVLVVHTKKFRLVNWVPSKLDIPVALPSSNELLLDQYLGSGLQPGEIELPENDPESAPTAVQFNEGAMSQLEAMGFPRVRCEKAMLATGNSTAEAAMEWLFAHMDDPDIDAPITRTNFKSDPSPEQVALLTDLGFTPAQVKKALHETDGHAERAVEWLFSHPDYTGEEAPVPGSSTLPARYRLKAFISHKGPSVHSGHYVAHVHLGDQWVLFNDEKVVNADAESVKELKKLAYLYFFEKVT